MAASLIGSRNARSGVQADEDDRGSATAASSCQESAPQNAAIASGPGHLIAQSMVRNSLDSSDQAARPTESFRRLNVGAVLIEVRPALDIAWRTRRNTIGFAGGVVGRYAVFCGLATCQQNRDQSQNSKDTHIRLPHSGASKRDTPIHLDAIVLRYFSITAAVTSCA
jgi:hypothetical protein